MASQSATRTAPESHREPDKEATVAVARVCPTCGQTLQSPSVESYGAYELFACEACDSQFWDPRVMPDARWYEKMYGGRDAKLLPLEPGHKYFLADPLAPGRGDLLDIGCGTGNFLVAAQAVGYRVTGTELDRNAARFAGERLGLERVLPFTVAQFAKQHPDENFDVVTFFEVLEHQASPAEFLHEVKACLKPHGTIAMSVPNRERWLTGPDVLDYPPNHFLRWNARALTNFLSTHGFEILSVREQAAGFAHTAQMIDLSLRTGLSRSRAGEAPASFRDVMQMELDQAEAVLHAAPTVRQRAMQMLRRIRSTVCFPAALAVYPYVWMRGYKGTYLYCLARLKD